MRTGLGVDAHRFVAGRKLVLGGTEVPFRVGLAGHSDADVVVHALMDALLGACAAGDIGEMFPDTDPQYSDASSIDLLSGVVERIGSLGFRVINVDIAVMCEEPRVGPYRDSMCENIAAALGIDRSLVSIKGTTTEGMGFTGRSEGIMAIASVLVE
ncbi:MAG: 2-C-methyl-D-erythritol 2,4-cyclodiphosphate synthase [Candidatus Geothermincolia bacterium]